MKTKTSSQKVELEALDRELHWAKLRARSAGEPLLAMKLEKMSHEVEVILKQLEVANVFSGH